LPAPQCKSEDGEAAVFIGTFLATGDTVALCDNCMAAWAAALLNAMTGIDPTPFIMALADDVESVDLEDDGVISSAAAAMNGETETPASPKTNGRTSRASRGRGTEDAPGGAAPPPEAIEELAGT
jgi:hypothetical protein